MEAGVVKRFFKKAAVAFALVTALNSQAMAVASLVTSIPSANEVVTERPQQVNLQFSDDLLSVIGVTVTGPRGSLPIVLRIGQYDKKQLYVSFFNMLGPGRYTVKWQVMPSDRHRIHGTYRFSVK
jgi:methionine-rich copper-binding protein CopC